MFIPGETVAHQFIIPFVRSDIGRIFISYYQDHQLILVKSVPKAQVKLMPSGNESYFVIILSQEESLLFHNDSDYYVQLNIYFTSSVRGVSIELKGSNGIQHIQEVVTSDG